MTSRERIQKALAHEEPDGVPIEFGATPTTGMHVSAVANLREHYGLEKRPVKVCEPYQMLGWVDEDLRDTIGIDVDGIVPRGTLFGFPSENWKEWRAPWGQEVLVPGHFNTTVELGGDVLIYPEGDTSAPPSARMPVSGFFFDTIVRQQPIEEDKLDPEDNLEEFGPIDEETLSYIRGEVERVKGSPLGRIGNFGGTGLGDIALIPAPFLKHPKGIRDIAEWYISTVTRQDYIHQIFSRQCEIALENLAKVHEIVGDEIDVLFVCGTDFGTQCSTFCSPETFDSLYAPYYKQLNGWVHANTTWKTLKHSCGAVESFIPHFVEAGFDILNPVQCSAAGMEPRKLKAKHGDSVVFWGGGVDTQQTLPFGTPEEVRTEVLERCRIFSRKGGFVFNAIHNVQANTPVENVVAMIDAVKEFNGQS